MYAHPLNTTVWLAMFDIILEIIVVYQLDLCLFQFKHMIHLNLNYCRTGHFRGHDIFADCRKIQFAGMMFSVIKLE